MQRFKCGGSRQRPIMVVEERTCAWCCRNKLHSNRKPSAPDRRGRTRKIELLRRHGVNLSGYL